MNSGRMRMNLAAALIFGCVAAATPLVVDDSRDDVPLDRKPEPEPEPEPVIETRQMRRARERAEAKGPRKPQLSKNGMTRIKRA